MMSGHLQGELLVGLRRMRWIRSPEKEAATEARFGIKEFDHPSAIRRKVRWQAGRRALDRQKICLTRQGLDANVKNTIKQLAKA